MDLSILAGVIAGFTSAKIISGRKTGQSGLMHPLIIAYRGYGIHIHHWIVALILGIFCWFFGVKNIFVYGFLLGLIIEGLLYKDFYKVIQKTKHSPRVSVMHYYQMRHLLFFLTIVLGFGIATLMAGSQEGSTGLVPFSLKWGIGNYIIHLHHWLIALLIIAYLFHRKAKVFLLYGLLLGILIQGLQYTDFFKIVYSK